MDDLTTLAEIDRLLGTALELADRLDLTMIGIHVDEARNLLRAGVGIGTQPGAPVSLQ